MKDMNIWRRLFGTDEPAKAEAEGLARKYLDEAERIPIPTEAADATFNMLGRALHFFLLALRVQTPVSPKEVRLFREHLAQTKKLVEVCKLRAADHGLMVEARLRLLVAALDVLESGIAIADSIRPSPERIALWDKAASEPLCDRPEQMQIDPKIKAANELARSGTKEAIGGMGFELTLSNALGHRNDGVASYCLECICEEIEKKLPKTSNPRDLGKLLVISCSGWVARSLLTKKFSAAADLLRQHG